MTIITTTTSCHWQQQQQQEQQQEHTYDFTSSVIFLMTYYMGKWKEIWQKWSYSR